jgi:GxxExxY protein
MRSVMGSLKMSNGFIEKVYENTLAHEMRKSGLGVVQQPGIVVFYDDVIVGEYTADLIVEDEVIVELKVVPAPEQRASPAIPDLLAGDRQAPSPPSGLLINFGRSQVEIRRITPSLACSVPSFACSVPSFACSVAQA